MTRDPAVPPPRNPAPDYQVLDDAVIVTALEALPGWTRVAEGKALFRSFAFTSFTEAFSFMTEAALHAEKINHHPEWFNVYGRVDVTLTTHAAKGLTDLDIRMATMMNRAAARRTLRKN